MSRVRKNSMGSHSFGCWRLSERRWERPTKKADFCGVSPDDAGGTSKSSLARIVTRHDSTGRDIGIAIESESGCQRATCAGHGPRGRRWDAGGWRSRCPFVPRSDDARFVPGTDKCIGRVAVSDTRASLLRGGSSACAGSIRQNGNRASSQNEKAGGNDFVHGLMPHGMNLLGRPWFSNPHAI